MEVNTAITTDKLFLAFAVFKKYRVSCQNLFFMGKRKPDRLQVLRNEILGPKIKKTKQKFYKICLSYFSEIYVMTGIQMKVKATVFSFFRTRFIVPKELLFGRFRAQN